MIIIIMIIMIYDYCQWNIFEVIFYPIFKVAIFLATSTYIVFTFTGSVRNVRNDVNIYIYIYICQQHGGHEIGTKSFGYISVKFIRLLLILSAKGLLDQKSSSKYYFSQ